MLSAATDPPQSHNDLRRAILTLTPSQRAVVYFAFWEDLDSSAIAEILRVNPSTVRRELSRVKQQVQEALS